VGTLATGTAALGAGIGALGEIIGALAAGTGALEIGSLDAGIGGSLDAGIGELCVQYKVVPSLPSRTMGTTSGPMVSVLVQYIVWPTSTSKYI
jgi:hypothetical protein